MEKTIASITKPKDEELKERLSAAREKLATLQIKVKEANLPVLVLFEGFGAGGKGSGAFVASPGRLLSLGR